MENEIIWTDLAMTSRAHSYVEGQSGNIVSMSKAIQSMVDDKPNMFDLLMLHAEARATSVDTERQEGKEYDVVFDIDMATDVDEILANWL